MLFRGDRPLKLGVGGQPVFGILFERARDALQSPVVTSSNVNRLSRRPTGDLFEGRSAAHLRIERPGSEPGLSSLSIEPRNLAARPKPRLRRPEGPGASAPDGLFDQVRRYPGYVPDVSP